MTLDVRPVCMFCQTRFTLAPGTTPTRCESWRSPDGAHVERRVATPDQLARLKYDAPQPESKPADIKHAEAKPAVPATGQSSLF